MRKELKDKLKSAGSSFREMKEKMTKLQLALYSELGIVLEYGNKLEYRTDKKTGIIVIPKTSSVIEIENDDEKINALKVIIAPAIERAKTLNKMDKIPQLILNVIDILTGKDSSSEIQQVQQTKKEEPKTEPKTEQPKREIIKSEDKPYKSEPISPDKTKLSEFKLKTEPVKINFIILALAIMLVSFLVYRFFIQSRIK